MSDVMLLGVLRMPFDDHGDLHLMQLKQRCQQAADRIEADAKELERLRVAFRRAARNDNSHYEHHEKRPFDNNGPEPDGTIWFTPREIARNALAEPELATTADAIKLAND